MMCTWRITAPSGSRIILTFNYFRLESGTCSTRDYLEVRDGSSSTSTRRGTYCGTYAANIISSGRYLWIRFQSGPLLSYKGFDARYTIVTPTNCYSYGVSCFSLSSTAKLLTSPNYPSNYPASANYFWSLKRPSISYGVRLTFYFFSLEASSSCRDDYVEIRDGDTFSKSVFIGKFCGTRIPPIIVSKYTYLFVKFISDSDYYPSQRYFIASFKAILKVLFWFYQFSSASVCSSYGVSYLSLSYTTKSLTSPNYPSNYPPSANCFWSLKRPSASYGVRLTFNSFYLEASIASSCRDDYVEISDGDTFSTSTSIGRICGSGIPPIIVSRYTYLFVKFISDFDYYPSRRYFSASFKAVLKVSSASQCSINSPFLHNNNLQLSSSSGGTLRSPSYPSNYPNNMLCTWKITAPSGSRLKLTFNYFRLESGPCSTRDYLEVRDGPYSTSTRKGTFCGTYALNIISSGRYLWIRFRSDSLLSYKGFYARYTIVTSSVCSSNGVSFLSLSSTNKSLTSPNYPSNYPPSANCFWSLKRPSTSYGVRLTFNSFSLEASSSCRDDYVEIRDGDTFSTSTFIGKFCGTRIPPIIVSRYTYIFAKFISNSDYYPSQRYFSASFKAILKVSSTSQCSINSPFLHNNNLQLSSSSGGTLRSPSYPSIYPNNMMCTWKITAPSGSRLKLAFNYFRLESGPCSTRDYLEVRDGPSLTSTRKGTYCGTYALNITSSGRYLWIRFRSDSSLSYKGFEAQYTIVTSKSSKTHVRTTSKTHVGTVVGVVVAIVAALAIIMAVIFLVKKKNRRATSHNAPNTSATFTMAMTQLAPNDDVRPMRLQFTLPGMQNGPPPSGSTIPRPPQKTGAPHPGSFSSMNDGCGSYPPPCMGMTVEEAPPPYPPS